MVCIFICDKIRIAVFPTFRNKIVYAMMLNADGIKIQMIAMIII